MNRRDFLSIRMAAIALWPVFSHTPFPQWKVYRQIHLFIAVNREDELACNIGRAIADTLATELPASRAMVTRARDASRLASLISTQQLDLALIHRSELNAWRQREHPYEHISPIPLQELFEARSYVLVSRRDFRFDHAALVRQTLESHTNLMTALGIEPGEKS